MYSLTQSAGLRGEEGEPLPQPWTGLDRLEVQFRRGEFSLVVAGPGTGKSLFALNLAIRSNVPCLYFSADSTSTTQTVRATAMITGGDAKRIKKALLDDAFEQYQGALSERWWIRFDFSARPTLAAMETLLLCYLEVFGVSPHLIVVDNVTNVDAGRSANSDSFAFALEDLFEYLSEMARETSAHVLGLHHTTGEYSDGLLPTPLSGVKGKVGRVPALVITIHKGDGGDGVRILNASPVKNREGFEDSSGGTFASLTLDRSTLLLEDVETELPATFATQ
ncbi:AAA family ATPase [Streptomyces buecherae]|uniref:AAA family ATPase n=1 Tax=Streptomyces buecherae TaxID=2763006 RepID=UPI00164E8086|nr:AAA family ATPase [Streptomyces buecherae]QNJ42032.1 AAA family ATPase [Streptomyces buecherae]